MPDLLERIEPRVGTRTETLAAERRLRADLRRQIAMLEARLGRLLASAFPRTGIEWGVGAVGGPRVLDGADLERVRDALAARLQQAQAELARRGEHEEANRGLLEAMIAEPEAYRWVRVSNEDIGERGCRHWHSRPRWGILGMFLNWWRVKLSSGCPLAEGCGATATPRSDQASAMASGARKRRKRRRRTGPTAQQGRTAPPSRAERRAQAARPPKPVDDRPPAPWGSFPLNELIIFLALCMLVASFIISGPKAGPLFFVGLALGSLATVEFAVRDHFTGYRSHSMLLAAVPAVIVLGLLFFLAPPGLGIPVRLLIGGAVFGGGFFLLTSDFRRRTGTSFKIR